MIDLHQRLTNPFDEPGILLGDLLVFGRDHLQRLQANNSGGLFSARIAATTAALGALELALTQDQSALALSQARKLAKQRFRETLPENISNLYSSVTRQFGPGTPQMADCFPAGRSAFIKADDDKLTDLLQILVTAVTALQPQLGGPAVVEARAMLSAWQAAHVPGESAAAAKTTTESATATVRAGFQLELFKNLLNIALNYPRVPELLEVYMQPGLLEKPPQPAFTPAPAPTTTGA